MLISVNTQCNINKEIKKLIADQPKIQNDKYSNGGNIYFNNFIIPNNLFLCLIIFLDLDTFTEKSVIMFHKPPLEVPTQVQYHFTIIILLFCIILQFKMLMHLLGLGC